MRFYAFCLFAGIVAHSAFAANGDFSVEEYRVASEATLDLMKKFDPSQHQYLFLGDQMAAVSAFVDEVGLKNGITLPISLAPTERIKGSPGSKERLQRIFEKLIARKDVDVSKKWVIVATCKDCDGVYDVQKELREFLKAKFPDQPELETALVFEASRPQTSWGSVVGGDLRNQKLSADVSEVLARTSVKAPVRESFYLRSKDDQFTSALNLFGEQVEPALYQDLRSAMHARMQADHNLVESLGMVSKDVVKKYQNWSKERDLLELPIKVALDIKFDPDPQSRFSRAMGLVSQLDHPAEESLSILAEVFADSYLKTDGKFRIPFTQIQFFRPIKSKSDLALYTRLRAMVIQRLDKISGPSVNRIHALAIRDLSLSLDDRFFQALDLNDSGIREALAFRFKQSSSNSSTYGFFQAVVQSNAVTPKQAIKKAYKVFGKTEFINLNNSLIGISWGKQGDEAAVIALLKELQKNPLDRADFLEVIGRTVTQAFVANPKLALNPVVDECLRKAYVRSSLVFALNNYQIPADPYFNVARLVQSILKDERLPSHEAALRGIWDFNQLEQFLGAMERIAKDSELTHRLKHFKLNSEGIIHELYKNPAWKDSLFRIQSAAASLGVVDQELIYSFAESYLKNLDSPGDLIHNPSLIARFDRFDLNDPEVEHAFRSLMSAESANKRDPYVLSEIMGFFAARDSSYLDILREVEKAGYGSSDFKRLLARNIQDASAARATLGQERVANILQNAESKAAPASGACGAEGVANVLEVVQQVTQ